MGLANSYLVTTKNFEAIFNAILSAKAPEKLTTTFLKNLGFTSSNDSLYIRLFKDLGLIDQLSIPTDKYYKFLDQTETKKVLAGCIEEAYSDLFDLNKKAHEMTEDEVKNKLNTLTQGTKDKNILTLMAKTFRVLCDYADWKPKVNVQEKKDNKEIKEPEKTNKDLENKQRNKFNPDLHYNIQIHLPETRDNSVYDAIFKSLKEHLL